MTRENLLEHVWGDSAYRDPRTIDVHIRHLREKLEADPRKPEYLFTVRGVGYRFRETPRRMSGSSRRIAAGSVRTGCSCCSSSITTAAVGFVYLYVVPQLDSSLTAEKLEPARGAGGRRASGRIDAAMRALGARRPSCAG